MKIIAVTGGAQGIGRAIAFHFAHAGFGVSIADLDEEAGEETIRKLREVGAGAVFVRADVSEPRDAESWMQLTAQGLGCPDVRVDNAGIARSAPFLQLSPADFDRALP